MMRTALLFLLFGLVAGASGEEARVYVGELRAVARDNIHLYRNDSLTMIGFVGDPSALAGLNEVRVGEQVRAVFGSVPRPGGNGRINKLLSIRRCTTDDAQCIADGKAQDAREAEAAKVRALSMENRAQCRREMRQTLLGDRRFASESPETSETVMRQFKSLAGPRAECAAAVVKDHRTAVAEACELHHCGDGIGGGCSHIAGYSLTKAVFARAVAVCKDR